eukprot:6182283-Pleurochrysis_carterae.AAC.4
MHARPAGAICDLTVLGCRALAEALSTNKTLLNLDLGRARQCPYPTITQLCSISAAGGFAPCVHWKCAGVVTLAIVGAGTQVSVEGCHVLAMALGTNTALSSIDLNCAHARHPALGAVLVRFCEKLADMMHCRCFQPPPWLWF